MSQPTSIDALFFAVVGMVVALGCFYEPDPREHLDPAMAPPPSPSECINYCVWEIQHKIFMEDRGPITKQRFNKITKKCLESCSKSYEGETQ